MCRTDDLERLLRQLNEALISGSQAGYVTAVRNLLDAEFARTA
ncbi:hypothetical protein [Neoroseomonas soli]|nr:hypothetical protein [Neoroseomonas soli]